MCKDIAGCALVIVNVLFLVSVVLACFGGDTGFRFSVGIVGINRRRSAFAMGWSDYSKFDNSRVSEDLGKFDTVNGGSFEDSQSICRSVG